MAKNNKSKDRSQAGRDRWANMTPAEKKKALAALARGREKAARQRAGGSAESPAPKDRKGKTKRKRSSTARTPASAPAVSPSATPATPAREARKGSGRYLPADCKAGGYLVIVQAEGGIQTPKYFRLLREAQEFIKGLSASRAVLCSVRESYRRAS